MLFPVLAGRSPGGSALGLASDFVWSGKFPFPASSDANLYKYLGVDGVVTVDLGENSSHLWNAEALPSLDTGTLGISTAWDLAAGGNTPVLTTDANYRLGTGNVLQHDNLADVIGTGAGTQKIPSAQDGTKSFLFGGLMTIDSLPEADLNAILIHQYNNSTSDGWYLSMHNTASQVRQLRFKIVQNGFATVHEVLAANTITYGQPFAFLCNLDVAAGKIKIMTSIASSYAELAWTDAGDFDAGSQPFRVGESSIPGIGSFLGKWGQMFAFEYSSTLDAGISAANMTNLLKYTDGFLTV